MSSDQFEQKLRQRLAQAEIQPPPQLWDRIEAGMAAPSGNKRRFLWLWWPMAALVLFSAGFVWMYQNQEQDNTYATATEEQVEENLPGPSADPSSEPASSHTPDRSKNQSSGAATATSSPEPRHQAPGPSQMPSHAQTQGPDHPAQQSIPAGVPALEDMGRSIPADTTPFNEPAHLVAIPTSEQKAEMDQQAIESSVTGMSTLVFRLPAGKTNPAMESLPLSATKIRQRTWSFDLGIRSRYTFGVEPPFQVSGDYYADYAGYANRSQYTSAPTSQVAAVRFPRWYHGLYVEAGKMLSARFRISLGLEGSIGLGGKSSLGTLQEDLTAGVSIPQEEFILVDQSSISLPDPAAFQHLSLSAPVTLSWLQPAGSGYFEHGIGAAVNYSLIRTPEQTQVESLAFPSSANSIPDPGAPAPVLQPVSWHADLRLRSRYLLPIGNRTELFLGAFFQGQLLPAFEGDAALNQRPSGVGFELGLRFR